MRKPVFITFLFLITVIFAGAINAAGLGRLTINSTPGQPFEAEIDLVAVKKEERPSLAVRLASRDTFRLAHVDYSPSLSTFKTSVETRPDGQPYIKVISPQPVVEPLLSMLIELNWSSGRLLREYTVLFPPAEAGMQEASAVRSSDKPLSSPGAASGPPQAEKMERASGKQSVEMTHEKETDRGVSNSIRKANTVYGPVKQGDTLGGIVRTIVPPAGVSFNQMLVALQRANSNAFLGNNIHQLKAGPILRIPDESEINSITRAEADKEVSTQTMDWHRRRSPEVINSIPLPKELKQTVSGKMGAADPGPGTAEELPREVLRLSRGEELPESGRNKSGTAYYPAASHPEAMPGTQGQLRMMEEDVIARKSSSLEASERIALLQKNINELQRLLELRRLALAEMQKQPEGGAGDASSTIGGSDILAVSPLQGETAPHFTATTPLAIPSSTLISMASGSAAGGTGAVSPTDGSLVEIAGFMHASTLSRGKPETIAADRSRSLIEDLTGNIEYLGGALVILITGIVGVSMSRRPREALFADFDSGRGGDLHEFPGQDKTVSGVPADKTEPASQSARNCDPDGVRGVNLSRSSHHAPSLPLSPALVALTSFQAVPGYPRMREIDLNTSDLPNDGSSAWYRQGRGTPWHEIVNKIDLARAYQEMGDRNAARQVLQEVMREGDIQQQTRAQALLANL